MDHVILDVDLTRRTALVCPVTMGSGITVDNDGLRTVCIDDAHRHGENAASASNIVGWVTGDQSVTVGSSPQLITTELMHCLISVLTEDCRVAERPLTHGRRGTSIGLALLRRSAASVLRSLLANPRTVSLLVTPLSSPTSSPLANAPLVAQLMHVFTQPIIAARKSGSTVPKSATMREGLGALAEQQRLLRRELWRLGAEEDERPETKSRSAAPLESFRLLHASATWPGFACSLNSTTGVVMCKPSSSNDAVRWKCENCFSFNDIQSPSLTRLICTLCGHSQYHPVLAGQNEFKTVGHPWRTGNSRGDDRGCDGECKGEDAATTGIDGLRRHNMPKWCVPSLDLGPITAEAARWFAARDYGIERHSPCNDDGSQQEQEIQASHAESAVVCRNFIDQQARARRLRRERALRILGSHSPHMSPAAMCTGAGRERQPRAPVLV